MADRDLLLHDAKNCLHVLTVNLEAIEDGITPLTESGIRNLNESLLTFQNILQQLVREIPRSADPATQASIDIVPLLRRVVGETKPLFDKRGISFSFSIEAAEVWIKVDATRFERMLHNLFSNEEKYVPSGGVLSGALQAVDGSRAVLTLQDNGPGIKPQYLNDIFKRSQRGVDPPQGLGPEGNPPQGLGLGLYQVEQTVASLGGSIRVENRPTGGLQISLSFPADAFLA